MTNATASPPAPARYARVGANVGGVAARIAGARLLGLDRGEGNAAALALGARRAERPAHESGQLMATIPDLLPPEYASELQKLQSDAPPMGRAFVRRRMMAELGRDWESRFARFDQTPAAAASLGQVHRALTLDGEEVPANSNIPICRRRGSGPQPAGSSVCHSSRMNGVIDTARLQGKSARGCARNWTIAAKRATRALWGDAGGRGPGAGAQGAGRSLDRPPADSALAGRREDPELRGSRPRRAQPTGPRHVRRLVGPVQPVRRHPWRPASGQLHRVPRWGGPARGINLLDYGCIRIFPHRFVAGVVDLYRGLREGDDARVVHAYEVWGFKGLSRDLIDVLNIWARFIYGPLMEDRVRTIADGVQPGQYGRREAHKVHMALKELGPVTVPREFVFMDRAAIGLGAVFLHLRAELISTPCSRAPSPGSARRASRSDRPTP